MGIFGSRALPRTSYGYTPPADATANGWRCACGEVGYEPPHRWPATCPVCACAVDPTFDQPWANEARRAEIDHRLTSPTADARTRAAARIDSHLWDYDEALASEDHDRATTARQELFRTTREIAVEDPDFVVGRGYAAVVTTALRYGDVAGATDELLTWHTLVNTASPDDTAQFTAACAGFLASEQGRRCPRASEIRAALAFLASEINHGPCPDPNQHCDQRIYADPS